MASTQPEISILIVSYNTREMTLACIRSVLLGNANLPQELIVVDNASQDGSAEAIAAEFPDVTLIRSPENLGFAKANNMAARPARGRYILLLNPDTIILDNAIGRLVDFANANPLARIWGGRTLFADRSLNPSSSWRFMSLWTLFVQVFGLSAMLRTSPIFNPEAYGGWKRDTVRQVDIVVGCFLLIERGMWEGLGGFDERFFMYAEEADLCYRAHASGARPLVTPDATIIHYGGASETARAGKIKRLYTGKCTFIRKHWPAWKARLGIAMVKSHVLVRMLGYRLASAVSGKPKFKHAAGEWLSVWQTRLEWSQGYPP